MPEIFFEERAVAFIDVLGFSALVDEAAGSAKDKQQLESLVGLLETAIPVLDKGVSSTVPAHLLPKHTYISDSIILSAPLVDSEIKHYSGLEIVVMRCIQLTHRFLVAGYLLRGGIAVGHVWHSDTNIVGPAYQEAYKIEANGCNPSIVLSDAAQERWSKGFGASSRMCVLNHGALMVNGLHDYYIEDQSDRGVKRAYEAYTLIVDECLASNLPPKAKAKWEWFDSLLESEKSEANKWHGFAQNAA